ncbi:FAH family protein [Pseudomonas fulva]|uniref:FAH family protein n=1 Tax=Pseudomonas fulva TaxID=47880 RepID=A0A2V4ITE1_9PSED|nr:MULTISPECIES: AraD1 family protein [Pseudomonas]HCP28404.1 FAH family protein [Pseudomonas sp.]MBA1208065.1 FAH family protein [Pseudomonas fulva]MBA1216627.1 FAH family protein [Pseudomonas fulva]MDH0572232.1 GguC family protein [Pseudomonas fulva]MDH1307311.1 GguC family protein [Pseudomonas fulva]
MRLIQFETATGQRHVGVVEGEYVLRVCGTDTTRELAQQAIAAGRTLADHVQVLSLGERHDYRALLAEGRVLPPLDHPDPAHCLVTGTGLTHLGSAATRDKMHQQQAQDAVTDSMRMFQWGMEGGRPPAGQVGAQPEWFYKGDGAIVVRPGADLPLPAFAEDAGEEPELVGLYLIGPDGTPYRLGYALGNEFSDHVMERRNYLYLAHSKLRACSFGPELRLGALPADLEGTSRILRDGQPVWSKPFLSGEQNMCHSFENLEFHHFKYDQFLRPGDIHVHYFGTATLSFADGIQAQPGDTFEISLPAFGEPLRNAIAPAAKQVRPGRVKSL